MRTEMNAAGRLSRECLLPTLVTSAEMVEMLIVSTVIRFISRTAILMIIIMLLLMLIMITVMKKEKI